MKNTVSLRMTSSQKEFLLNIGRGSLSKGFEQIIDFYQNEGDGKYVSAVAYNEGIEQLERDIDTFERLFGDTKQGRAKLKKFNADLARRKVLLEQKMVSDIESRLANLKIVN